MKKALFILVLLVSAKGFAQTRSCCSISSSESFARLSKDPVFQASHLAPLPFSYTPDKGAMVAFSTPDGKEGHAFEVKPAKAGNKIVFMFHEWWGLNGYIKQEAEKLQEELGDVTVYAIDLYDGKIADNAKDAATYMGEVKEERAKAIIQGALNRAGKNAKIYTIGWCFGGGWSMQASLLAGKQADGCVMYYGMPEKEEAKLKNMHAPVLGIFGTQDKWISPAVVAEFEKNMKAAGKKLSVKSYDADHAFANPSNPKYNKEFSADAHKLVLEFYKTHMK
jgi:carboxymethylenebutenolidase